MNSSDLNQNEMTMPSLFQIAAFFEDFFPAGGSQRPASELSHPFANLMSQPEKLKALLLSARFEKRSLPPDREPRARAQWAQKVFWNQPTDKK